MGKLEYIRRISGITKKDAAEKLHMTYVYYCQFERGKKAGSLDLWLKVQELFNIDDAEMWMLVKEHYEKALNSSN